ncbi:aminopeptidase P family protein [Rhizobium ruizarguesonis]|jgi:Xaa-Pro aminopeptidase|uniref:Aminopeptidase P family protein n=1 Tax=Rhizobium ruizarguesonis TaxID=2081791 RepID=A0AAE8QA97_9HYPH|nr:Xaa-Pro peptidase family protein [Rhizobium ruizarguesonis]MBY5834611.1 aminopeptidase P family protein [Rhizobium leguminosarum]NKJ76143.1 M24 family metallopeptidase [Rhizobium leguminosarum bv. viciae]MBC2802558.1 aminopeptidase P family protein [Rhizobium ruizarguesonis]MBY5855631.1 aminopeptidase P family protein [Rhizobium leguminosarum]MBY5862858.1 aminopeptidase P family protein [Rhizobium leguminosarum]
MNMRATNAGGGMGSLLADFHPDFDFSAPLPLPVEEFEDRLRRIRRQAVEAGHDALIVHAGSVGWFHASNAYLRYICDWMREGVLIIPTDADKAMVLLSFFTQSVLLPPGGEPVLVDEIWQIGPIGREYADRPGDSVIKTAEKCAEVLASLGLAKAQIGRIGDRTSLTFWSALDELMPKSKFVADNAILDRMQKVRSLPEIEMFRAAAQLISIGTQAAYHVAKSGVTDHEMLAAFTYAQMALGGETGDGYQIGINEFGTHCGKPYGHIVRPGDLINLYISNVTYRGYTAQTARMIAIGDITSHQEEVLAACTEGVKRAEKLIRPGALMRDVNNAAFEPMIERGMLTSPEARTMPYNWSPMEDGGARLIPHQYVKDIDWEAQGRKLMHVYPATHGPHNPNLGHSVGMAGGQNSFNISSHNYDRMEEGMVFVLHTQWLEPLSAGCNIGDMYVVTKDGFENLSRHTPLETHRVAAEA